jgi:crotonobetainyl-CoA:carnitine CoA-transferase CaiB-like acyl-CoA transferase
MLTDHAAATSRSSKHRWRKYYRGSRRRQTHLNPWDMGSNLPFRAIGQENEDDRDSRLKNITARTRNYDYVYIWFSDIMETRTTAEWMQQFEQADIPFGPMHELDSLIDDPHPRRRRIFAGDRSPDRGHPARRQPAIDLEQDPALDPSISAAPWRTWRRNPARGRIFARRHRQARRRRRLDPKRRCGSRWLR